MDAFGSFVLYTLPYLIVPFYVGMIGFRFWVWVRFYNPAVKLLPGAGSMFQIWRRQYRPTINIFPARPRSRGTEVIRTVKGFLFFSGLFKRDKALWVGSWVYHVALGLVMLAHVRLFWMVQAWESTFDQVSKWGCLMVLISGIYLLIRRVVVKRVREITDFRDYLAEFLVLAVVGSAYPAIYHDQTVTLDQVRTYLMGLVTFSGERVGMEPVFVWHFFLLNLLLAVMPFSHLLHFGGIFLSRHFLGSSDTFAGAFEDPREAHGD